MPSKLPLLRLPLLPFEQILDSLNLKDLIELSVFSKKMYNRIHSSQLVKFNDVRMSVTRVHGLYDKVHLTSDQLGLFRITSSRKKEEEGRLKKWFTNVVHQLRMRKERDGGCVQVCYSKERFIEEDEEENPIFQIHDWDRANRKDDYLFWVQYLKELFYVTTYSFIFLWFKEPSDFDKYFKRNNLFLNAESVTIIGGIPMSHEELEFLLDNLTTDGLKIDLSLKDPESFQYNKKIRFSHLEMPDFSWMSEDQLLDLLTTTKRNVIKNTTVLTESFLNKFLKQWLNSSNDTLQEVQIWSKPYSKSSKVPVFDKKKVLEGITGLIMFDQDPEKQSLEQGITIYRDKNTSLTFKVETRMDSLFFKCSSRDWRRLYS